MDYTEIEQEFLEDVKKSFAAKYDITSTDLCTGDIVLFRNDKVGIVIRELYSIITVDGSINMNNINADLTAIAAISKYDIVAVRRVDRSIYNYFDVFKQGDGKLIYERKDT